MAKRLVKVAKELNVGTKTLVDYLKDSGFEIKNRPTEKVTDDMYDLLLKKFHKSISIKEKADQITIGIRKTTKKEEEGVVEEKVESKTPPPRKEKKVEPLFEPKKEVKETPKEEDDNMIDNRIKGPKVLGKIDLNEANKRGRRGKGKSSKKEESPKTENLKKETPKKTPPREEKKEEKSTKEPVKKEQTPPVEKKATPKVEAKKGEEKAEKKESKVKKDEDTIKTEAPQLQGLKILGKINLDNNRGKKKRSGKKDDTKNEKDDNGAKRKRRRRRKVGGNEEQNSSNNSNNNNNNNSGNNSNNNRSGSNNSNRSGGGRGGDNRSRNNTGQGGKRGRRRGNDRNNNNKGKQEPREISQKEIQDKIKATMARLSGNSKRRRRHGSTRSERDERKEQELQRQEAAEKEPRILQVTEFVSVSELANLMDAPATDVIMACMNLGVIVSINQRLDAEIIELVASEFDFEVKFISAEEQVDVEDEDEEDDPEASVSRAPIVTVMGHVDHGKTSLLDYIRKANVAAGEAGGITQHVGAYEVNVKDKGKVTFLDTPGHEAFTAMRARGAKVTDVAVIIISADDRVMPQTKEAISHAQAAGVPIVFAINKIDKPGADPDRIKQELSSMNLLVEEWGGEYQSQDISAKQGLNIEELLEKILLEAELLDLKANPDRPAIGTIVEASLDKGRGYVAKSLVRTGTLRIGDPIVAGSHSGRVKAMFNEHGERITEAGPSTPVLVLGLSGAPQAGEKIKVMGSEPEARELAQKRAQITRQQQIRASRRITLDEIGRRLKIGDFKELNLIVKGDVDGSVEALSDELLKLSTEAESVQVNVIHKAVGGITESDVNLALASDAIVIGFQVRPNPTARRLAEQEEVEIKLYSVIYEAIDEVKAAIEGMLEPKEEEREVGSVEVREVYKISKVGTVAGCFVQSGKVTRNNYIRVIRDNVVAFPQREGQRGEISSLRRFKDDVREVKSGFECGLSLKNYNDLRAGDIIEVYEIVEVKQTLGS